jgi:hypothetical protein
MVAPPGRRWRGPPAPRWLRHVPLVGLILLLVRWRRRPRPADPNLDEQLELTDAWLVTLGALLGLTVLLLVAEILSLR